MDFLKKLLGAAGGPSVPLPAPIANTVAHFEAKEPLPPTSLLEQMRIVVLDISTSGLEVAKDRMTGIAAVGIERGMIDAGDSFAVDLAAPEDNRDFALERQLAGLLEFVGNSPVVAYPAPFVSGFLSLAMRNYLGVGFSPVWVDLASMMPELYRDQIAKQVPVDDWLHLFGIEVEGRHDPLVDAFAEAKLLQIAMVRLAQREIVNLGQLVAAEKARQWLRA